MDAKALDALAGAGAPKADGLMDEAAFRALYEQAAPRLRGYLRRAAGNAGSGGSTDTAALADDILQESFLKLLSTPLPAAVLAPMPADDRQLRAYLYRIATNILTDHWRRARRERRWNLLNFFRSRPEAQGEPVAPEFGDNHLSIDTARAFARLKPREQSLLWLAYVEGFDHAEIAGALGLGERSVRVLLHRARRRLEQTLSEARPFTKNRAAT